MDGDLGNETRCSLCGEVEKPMHLGWNLAEQQNDTQHWRHCVSGADPLQIETCFFGHPAPDLAFHCTPE